MRQHPIASASTDTLNAKSRTSAEMFLRIASYLARYKALAVGTMGCAILYTVLGFAYPKLTQLIIDQIVQRRTDLLGPCAIGLGLAFLFRDAFNALRIRLNNTFEQHVVFDMRRDLYKKLQTLPVHYYDQRATGDIMTRVIDDITSVERVLIDGTEQGTVALLSILGGAFILFHVNAHLAFLALLPVPILALGALIYTRTAHGRYRIQRKATSAMNALLHDNLQGIRQIKAFARYDHEIERFTHRANELRESTLIVMKAWSIYSPTMALAAALGIPIILYFGGLKVIHGELSLGNLVGFLAYLSLFYDPVTRLHSLNQLFQAGRAAGERVFDILDAVPEAPDAPDALKLSKRVKGDIHFEKVSFQYSSTVPVLHEVSFHMKPGETVALVGPTGAGKSTILNLIPRFYEASHGRILLDGNDTQKITLGSLREQIGIVSQEPFLFNGTLRENILYGNLEATEEKMMDAARAANAHEFISRLPEGYESRVGERGVKLSVGEKQRVSIARALLKDPAILLLDEATASVDTETERLIQQALERLMSQRTSLVIAHRLSTVRRADQILVLERGGIVERGTHEELMTKNGLYSRLCRIQGTSTLEETFLELGIAN